jgi:large-conductance mechanosensitive channel
MVVMNFFITNLFVGIVVSAYNREEDKITKEISMNVSKSEFSETKMMVFSVKPK